MEFKKLRRTLITSIKSVHSRRTVPLLVYPGEQWTAVHPEHQHAPLYLFHPEVGLEEWEKKKFDLFAICLIHFYKGSN